MFDKCIKCGNNEIRVNGMCVKCYKHQHYLLNKEKNKETRKAYNKKWQKDNRDKRALTNARHRQKIGIPSISENRKCSCFLGIHVAERVLSKVFNNVERQPLGNPGFDFICGKGYKIDVKSSCLIYAKDKTPRWQFVIKKNKIADYFLCLAFDNRENLNPMYMWLIPAQDVNKKESISSTITMISKWDKYALNIDKVSACCNVLRLEK